MKKFFGAILIALSIASLLFAPSALADKDNFHISKFDVEMELSRDAKNRSILKTKETIVAEFPNSNQNHGLVRELVKTYKGHSTDLKIVSVKDASGKDWKYHTEGDSLMIGDANRYVRGQQTYVIEYTQRDVTHYYQDVNKDEFYWDVIGTEWRVPISEASFSLRLKDLPETRLGEAFCYYGPAGDTHECQIEADGDLIQARLTGLNRYEGVTVAVGFKPGTFAAYERSVGEIIMIAALVTLAVLNLLGLIAAIIMAIIFYRKRKQLLNTPEISKIRSQAVVPQYLPPEGRSVLQSSQVYQGSVASRALSGHLIDWAVRHFTTISQIEESGFLKQAAYRVELIKELPSAGGLSAMSSAIFGRKPAVGATFTTKDLQKRSSRITSRLRDQSSKAKNSDLYYLNPEVSQYAKKMSKIAMTIGKFGLSVAMVVLSSIIGSHKNRKVISPEGEKLKKHLEGLKLYIGVAEEERLKMLQAPGTAERVGDVASDKGARIKLYERVLPYAILFGQEDSWAKELGQLYTESGQSPDWTAGDAAFSAAMFSSMVSGFSSSVSSAGSYSSDSGGSSGGGFSGGGGGGGGGGGW